MFSLFSSSSSSSQETKECTPDPVFTVVHRTDAVCALVADLMRLQAATERLKEVFNPTLLSKDQQEALLELFQSAEELFGPDDESEDDDTEQPVQENSIRQRTPGHSPGPNTMLPVTQPNLVRSQSVIPLDERLAVLRNSPHIPSLSTLQEEESPVQPLQPKSNLHSHSH